MKTSWTGFVKEKLNRFDKSLNSFLRLRILNSSIHGKPFMSARYSRSMFDQFSYINTYLKYKVQNSLG